jgi:hypothetical protein
MTTLGNISLTKVNGTAVTAVVKESSARTGFGEFITVFTVEDSSSGKQLGRSSLCGNKIQGWKNDTDKLGPEKVNGVGKILIECTVAKILSQGGKTLKVQASGGRSPWAYSACGFVPEESMVNTMERFRGSYWIFEKLQRNESLNEQEKSCFEKARSELAKELNVAEDSLTTKDICFGNQVELIPKIFARARAEKKPVDVICNADVMMFLSEAGRKQMEKRILASPLKYSDELLQKLKKEHQEAAPASSNETPSVKERVEKKANSTSS